MKTLQLFRENRELLGSDGRMFVDGRLCMENIKKEVRERNKRMINFPHMIADSFAICVTRNFISKKHNV